MAERIERATLVELDGADHVFAAMNLDQLVGEVVAFLTGNRPATPLNRYAATILFTDTVDSTKQLALVGDRQWSERLDQHDRAVRQTLDRFDGDLIAKTGDGALAIFDAPARAVQCAWVLGEALTSIGLEMRAGIHTGEIQRRGRDISGLAVHIAARLESLAGAGEIVVSRNVIDLVAASGIEFRDHGRHALKDVPGEWQAYAVASA
jgi:class 3 adenylate cyclase